MSEIIVLGLIPGTHIQITFLLWLVALAGVTIFALVRYSRRRQLLRTWLVATSVMLLMRRPNRALF